MKATVFRVVGVMCATLVLFAGAHTFAMEEEVPIGEDLVASALFPFLEKPPVCSWVLPAEAQESLPGYPDTTWVSSWDTGALAGNGNMFAVYTKQEASDTYAVAWQKQAQGTYQALVKPDFGVLVFDHQGRARLYDIASGDEIVSKRYRVHKITQSHTGDFGIIFVDAQNQLMRIQLQRDASGAPNILFTPIETGDASFDSAVLGDNTIVLRGETTTALWYQDGEFIPVEDVLPAEDENMVLSCMPVGEDAQEPLVEVTPDCALPQDILRRGDATDAVLALQNALQHATYDVGDIDGDFGLKTWFALVQFQKDADIPPSGVFDTETRTALEQKICGDTARPVLGVDEMAVPVLSASQCSQVTKKLKFRDSAKDTVRTLQKMLSRLGYATGPRDGDFGVKTIRAVVAFQRDNDLAVTGQTDESTQSALNSTYANTFCPNGVEVDEVVVVATQKNNIASSQKCSIDLKKNSHDGCLGARGLWFLSSPSRGESVLGINLDTYPDAQGVLIDIDFETKIQGWLLHIGDSPTNNGWGGDAGTKERNSEFHVRAGLISTYRDALSQENKKDIAMQHDRFDVRDIKKGSLQVRVENEIIFYTLKDVQGTILIERTLQGEHIFALDGKDDAQGSDRTLYIGLNRTVFAQLRDGRGVSDAVISVYDTDGSTLAVSTAIVQ